LSESGVSLIHRIGIFTGGILSGALAFILERSYRKPPLSPFLSYIPASLVSTLGLNKGPYFILLGSSCGAYALLGAEIVLTLRELRYTYRHLRKNRIQKERFMRLSVKLALRVLNCLGQVAAVVGAR
jgi:hypothetical protein